MTPASSKPALTRSQSDLLDFLFEARPGAMRDSLSAWVAASPRFAGFVGKYKDKIRKKLRVTQEPGAAADLLYELQIAYWLLQEPRFELAYEPYLAGKTRGPDYAVTFRANFTFNLEVTHLRGPCRNGETAIDFHLVDVLCNKLHQLRAGMANLLFVVCEPQAFPEQALPAHLAWIRAKAERSDPLFYARQAFLNPSDFFKYYERLSGLVLHDPAGARPPVPWLNPQARVRLTEQLRKVLERGWGSTEAGAMPLQ